MTDCSLPSLLTLSPDEQAARLRAASPEDLLHAAHWALVAKERLRQENQLHYFQAVNPRSLDVFRSTARQVIVKGGKRSAKTDTLLVELAIQMTGLVPESLRGLYPATKVRPPIRARHMSESLTDTLVPIILPKLKPTVWSGTGTPGDLTRGHWGWMPAHLLPGGKWETAYSEKHRTLTLANGSTCQFMSYDQDPEAGEGASLHLVLHDEPPPRAWYKVNQMRTLDVQGQVYTGYTPPTEPDRAARSAWIFDEVVEPGLPGPDKDPLIDVIVLWTEQNRILDAAAIAETVKGFTEVERRAILYGEETHLSGRIHPLFTDREQWWCFACGAVQMPVEGGHCPACPGDLERFSHVVEDWDVPVGWPCYFVMDPHERRPCAMSWYRVGPGDTVVKQAEAWAEGTVRDWRKTAERVEKEVIGREPDRRLCDPNPLDAQDHRQRQGWTLRRELSDHGLRVVAADDNFTVGRRRVDEALTPDVRTRAPRYTVMRRCARTIHAYLRYTWDEYVRREGKEPKGRPREEHKHFPDCVDGETEALTEAGWIRFDALPTDLKVATLSLRDACVEFQFPTEYVQYDHHGPMVAIAARGVNLLCTPNHRLLVYAQSPRLSWRLAGNLHPQDRLPVMAQPDQPEHPLTMVSVGASKVEAGAWAAFLGWYLAEGSATGTRGGKIQLPGRGYSICVAQKEGSKADTIAELLQRLPWKFRRMERTFVCSSKELWDVLYPLGHSETKYIPRSLLTNLLPEHKERLWSAIVNGDGWHHKGNDTVATVSQVLANDLTELLSRLGSPWSVSRRWPAPSGLRDRPIIARHEQYYVTRRTNLRAAICTPNRTPRYRTVRFDGPVYCVSVPNRTLLVRRHGLPVFVGNCDRYLFQDEPTYYITRQVWTPRKGTGRNARTGY